MLNGKPISKMTLGTVQLGLQYGIANRTGRPTCEESFKLLDTAIAGGVTVLDTAAAYGESEATIGAYLRQNPAMKEKLVIVTKFMLKQKELSFDQIKTSIHQSVECSLQRLGIDYIDLLLMHDAAEFQIDPDGIQRILSELRDNGYVKTIGASAYRFEEIEPLLERDLFEAYQLPINLLDQRYGAPGESYEKMRQKTIFARSIYLQGLFFKKPEELTGNLTVMRPHVEKVRQWAKDLDRTVAQLCMAYVRSLPWVDSLVVGAELPEQVADNLKNLQLPPIPATILKEIETSFTQVPDVAFDPSTWNLAAT